MEWLRHFLDTFLAWALLPPTIYGAGGAMLRAVRTGRGWKLVCFEVLAGIIIANMIGPLMTEHAPSEWHPTLYFLAGWAGLEAVDWVYDKVVKLIAERFKIKIDQGKPWDGKDRRNPEKKGE